MSGTIQPDPGLAALPPLDAEARHLLVLATWIGHLERLEGTSGTRSMGDPPGHWHAVLAAFLAADDRTSRWVQSAADAGFLGQAVPPSSAGPTQRPRLPGAALVWRARRNAMAGWAPQGADGYFTISVAGPGGLLQTAAELRANDAEPVGAFHLLAALVLRTTSSHEKDLMELAPSGIDALRGYIALWLFEFRDLSRDGLELERPIEGWFFNPSQSPVKRPPLRPASHAFVDRAAAFAGGGRLGPWLEALLATGAPEEPGIARFLAEQEETLRTCFQTGPAGPSNAALRFGGMALLARAFVLADRASPGQELGVRHLLGALLAADATLPPLPADPPGDAKTLRAVRIAFLACPPESGDLPAVWADAILGETLARIPVPLDTGDTDRLDVLRYARALAAVIADKDVVPPLSIGLFGAWGSGKSFLIDRIREQLQDISDRSVTMPESRFCRGIVPVDFNAWHYAETNLWASLFVRILEVLGEHLSGTQADATAAERGRVLAEIGRYTAELGAVESGISSKRKALEEAREKAQASAGLRAVLSYLVRGTAPAGVSSALEQATAAASLLQAEFTAARTTLGSIAGLWRRLGKLPRKPLAISALISIVLAVIVAVVWSRDNGKAASSFLGLLTGAAGTATYWLRTYRKWIDEQIETLNKEVKQPDADPTIAAAAEKLRLDEDRAASLRVALAGLRVQAEVHEPRRRLADFIAARASSDDYEKLLGTPALIRRDLERLTAYLEDARKIPNADKPVDRIVLIVDDLDRCGPEAVVRVLEAIHILLSSKLFVVIVGVDPRWLSGALAERFKGLLGKDGDGDANVATPFEFIEKIFQVPFRVPGMSEQGRRDLAAAALPAPRLPAPRLATVPMPGLAVSAPRPAAAPASGQADAMPSPPTLPTVKPVILEQTEHALLLTLAASAGDTPRRIKRFLRCYLILRASLNRDQLAVWYEAGRFDPAARLLAAANGAPGSWRTLRRALLEASPGEPMQNIVPRVCAPGSPDRTCLNTIFGAVKVTVEDLLPWTDEVERFTFPAWGQRRAAAAIDHATVAASAIQGESAPPGSGAPAVQDA